LVVAAQRELGQLVGSEYLQGLRRAIRAEVKVERNAAALAKVRNQLAGGN
jgi:hypothetical protein